MTYVHRPNCGLGDLVDVHPDAADTCACRSRLGAGSGPDGHNRGDPIVLSEVGARTFRRRRSIVLELAYTPVRWCPITDSQDLRYEPICRS